MMMVDIYNTLPQLQYQGKYPSSIVSPPEPDNAPSTQPPSDVEMQDGQNGQIDFPENGTTHKPESQFSASPASKPPSRLEIRSARRSSSVSMQDRSRSPSQPASGAIDLSRSLPHSPARSQSRRSSQSHNTDYRHSERAESDRYSSSSLARKRLADDDYCLDGRERKRYASEEMSEGEIRPHSRDTPRT
jgi:hypothetical protein